MDENRSNPALDKEKAEGSRETVEAALDNEGRRREHEERGREEESREARQGVTNQPLEEERRQQEKVPPRGQRKGDVSA